MKARKGCGGIKVIISEGKIQNRKKKVYSVS